MIKLAMSLLLAFSTWSAVLPAQALTQEDIVRELIGAPVMASDGVEVGTVADIELDDEGDFKTLHMKTAQYLGFGERVLEIPGADFIALRGMVVLDAPSMVIKGLGEHR